MISRVRPPLEALPTLGLDAENDGREGERDEQASPLSGAATHEMNGTIDGA